MELSQDEVVALSGEMDRDGDGEVNYADFRSFVLGAESETFARSASKKKKKKKRRKEEEEEEEEKRRRKKKGAAASSSLARSPEWYDAKLGEIARRIRKQIGGEQWFKFFNSYDSEGNGFLSRAQFREAMDELLLHGPRRRDGEGEGTALTQGDYASLFSAFDANGSGKVSLSEFRKLMEYESQPGVQADALLKQLAIRARRFVRGGGDFSRIFRAFDVSGSGTVTRAQARKGVARLGVRGDEAPNSKEMASLFARFDQDGDGVVSYRDFETALLPRGAARYFGKARGEAKKAVAVRRLCERLRALVRRKAQATSLREAFNHFSAGAAVFTLREFKSGVADLLSSSREVRL